MARVSPVVSPTLRTDNSAPREEQKGWVGPRIAGDPGARAIVARSPERPAPAVAGDSCCR
jgi:hypothetical protein